MAHDLPTKISRQETRRATLTSATVAGAATCYTATTKERAPIVVPPATQKGCAVPNLGTKRTPSATGSRVLCSVAPLPAEGSAVAAARTRVSSPRTVAQKAAAFTT